MKRAFRNEGSSRKTASPSLPPPRHPARQPVLAFLPTGHGIRMLIKLGKAVNLCCYSYVLGRRIRVS